MSLACNAGSADPDRCVGHVVVERVAWALVTSLRGEPGYDKMLMRVVKSLVEDDFSLGLELNLDLQHITTLREQYPDERDVVLF